MGLINPAAAEQLTRTKLTQPKQQRRLNCHWRRSKIAKETSCMTLSQPRFRPVLSCDRPSGGDQQLVLVAVAFGQATANLFVISDASDRIINVDIS